MTRNEFVEKATRVHGDLYDYSLVTTDVKWTDKISIVCKDHGVFLQTPTAHISSRCGCQVCSGKLRLTSPAFIRKAQEVHGDRYDYSKVQYKNASTKVVVGCKVHGDFEISPDAHANGGQGCRVCWAERLGNLKRGNLDKFLNRAIEVHGKRYDYSLVTEYTTDRHKVNVICKLHGPFSISPNNHQRGRGCPGCKTSGYRLNLPGYLYVLTSDTTTKVGITNRQPSYRARETSRSAGKQFDVVHSIFLEDGSRIAKLEHYALAYLRDNYQAVAEEYKGSTESFVSVDLDALIKKIAVKVTQL